jgi:hypothetical protein
MMKKIESIEEPQKMLLFQPDSGTQNLGVSRKFWTWQMRESSSG